MKHSKKTVAKKIFKYTLVALAVVVGLHLFLQVLNLLVFKGDNFAIFELSNRFDLDDEESVATWYSQFLFIGIALTGLLAAWLETSSKPRRALWSTLAIIATVFSIDEVATTHEFVLTQLHVAAYGNSDSTLLQNGWIIVAPFVLAIGIALVWWIFRMVPKRTFILLATAGFVFLAGSMGVEVITNAMTFNAFTSEGILVAMEEGMELLGSTIALYAMADYIERRHGKHVGEAFKRIKAGRDKTSQA